MPWYAKAIAVVILAYALSPLDLIPDFIPVVGYLDDLVLIPAGLVLVRRLIPAAVLAEHRQRAETFVATPSTLSKVGAALVILIWVVLGVAIVLLVL